MSAKPEVITRWLIALAALSFVPTLFFYLTGEEGIYTITSMEMWHEQNWLQQIMYGADNGRPPLVNWLIMPLAELIGWSHVTIATRLVSVTATLGTVGWLYWLSRRLAADKLFAQFAALTCLALADLLLYRGWLSYTDPVFAFFTFGAMATLWVSATEQRVGWLLLSVVLVSCALLTKAFTAYIFYGTVAFVLLWQLEPRKFLLAPESLFAFLLALVVPLLWFASTHQGSKSAGMLSEITRKLSAQDLSSYLQHLAIFPLDVMLRLSPAILLALYLLWRKRVIEPEHAKTHFHVALWIAVLGFLPYWLSPQSSIRYLLPIYPMIALVCARLIWRTGEAGRELALRWFSGIIAFKFVFALALFPYYQTHYRGENYTVAARNIMQLTAGYPLYVTDVSSPGLCVTGFIDAQRFPQPPIVFPPTQWDSGFVISRTNDPLIGKLVREYKLASDDLFLLCRGAACAAWK
ncbi:MAG TPA: glycosyltransferase family 39 protein [Gallionella sp.]|nr:glycosyltransferase family 39 protein [Gallionella sp.]